MAYPRTAINMVVPFSLLLVAYLSFLSLAQGAERVGDASFVNSYQQHARTAVSLENEMLLLIETAPGQERFNSYRTYNRFIGTWLQTELLQAQLVVAVAANSFFEEEEARVTLRDQAQFVLWELEQAEVDLEQNIPELGRPGPLRLNDAMRELLLEVRATISNLLFEQCALIFCEPDR